MKQKGFEYILIILLVLILGVGAFIYYSGNKSTKDKLVEQSTSVTPAPETSKIFTSKELGISFKYNSNSKVEQIGNRIYINDLPFSTDVTQGQFVEVFDKNPKLTLTQAVKQRFLAGKSEKDCFIKQSAEGNGNIYITVSDSLLHDKTATDQCAGEYANGLGFFVQNPKHTDKFLYFEIGQYFIEGENGKSWYETIVFLD